MDLKLENLDGTCLGTEEIPPLTPHISDSDSEGDALVMEFKAEEEEEQDESIKKRRAVETRSKYQLRNQYVSKQDGRHPRETSPSQPPSVDSFDYHTAASLMSQSRLTSKRVLKANLFLSCAPRTA